MKLTRQPTNNCRQNETDATRHVGTGNDAATMVG
jgi:hypothetical protein